MWLLNKVRVIKPFENISTKASLECLFSVRSFSTEERGVFPFFKLNYDQKGQKLNHLNKSLKIGFMDVTFGYLIT